MEFDDDQIIFENDHIEFVGDLSKSIWKKPELVQLSLWSTLNGTLPFVEAGEFGTLS